MMILLPRLSQTLNYPLDSDSFLRCQSCGVKYDDICMLNFWWEGDDELTKRAMKQRLSRKEVSCLDKSKMPMVLLCKNCRHVIDNHPRVYFQVPWSRGGPGVFTLVCGNCPYRRGVNCTNPKAIANGGIGLEGKVTPMFSGTFHLSYADGSGEFSEDYSPVTYCEGNPNAEQD